MTSVRSTPDLPTPQIFTISSLPSYEDALKISTEPPSYEQALKDPKAETVLNLEGPLHLACPSSDQRTSNPSFPENQVRRKVYRLFCYAVCVVVVLVLSYIIYMMAITRGADITVT